MPLATQNAAGLMSASVYPTAAMLTKAVSEAELDKALTLETPGLIQRSLFIAGITPTANYAMVLRQFISAGKECQYYLGYDGSIYFRDTTDNGLTWSKKRLIAPTTSYKGWASDTNLAIETGEYGYNPNTKNAPAPEYYSVSVTHTGAYVTQRLYAVNSTKVYTRISVDFGATWKKYVLDAPGTVMNV